jgi:pyruvate dehydrogenase E2 component (dihydrolipoamide acetyltransferase)
MEEGTIVKWHKKEGDRVAPGDLLLEISTDKATIEHNALDGGFLRKILIAEGQSAPVGAPLAVLTETSTEEFQVASAPAPQKAEIAPAASPQAAPARPAKRVPASPLARHIAQTQGLNLEEIKGSGPQGRVMSRDLAKAEGAKAAAPRGALREAPLSPIRKVLAERIAFSAQTIPHFFLHQEVDVGALSALREEVKKQQLDFTVNDFIVKATACALKKHPDINVSYDTERELLIQYPAIDICVAVTAPGAIFTPVIRDTDTKPLAEISHEIKALALRAREGKLRPEEFLGGSFTISNLGMFGVTSFDSIINPPQGAILAVGTIQDKPVVKNGAVTAGKLVMLTLSCDHRVIDGAQAAGFLKSLKQLLENPVLFLSE